MVELTGSKALFEALKAEGVKHIFGIPGGAIIPIYDALYDEHEIRHILTRHEQGAAYMAFGYSQSTGRVGTYTVVPGPGLLNTGAALCTAYGCGAPVLCITGQIPSRFIGKGYGQLHEIADQMGLDPSKIRWLIKVSRRPLSLEKPVGEEEDSELGEFIEDEDSPTPTDSVTHSLLERKMDEVLATLSPREARILRLRFGLQDGRSYTLKEVGEKFGLTRERIRQIEREALGRLRHPSRSRQLRDYMAE